MPKADPAQGVHPSAAVMSLTAGAVQLPPKRLPGCRRLSFAAVAPLSSRCWSDAVTRRVRADFLPCESPRGKTVSPNVILTQGRPRRLLPADGLLAVSGGFSHRSATREGASDEHD